MGAVSLRGVEKSYGSVRAIRGVDLEIADGEFVALVGPSGCGKSTLLRMIAGLEDITGGEIAIAGQVVNDLTPRERNIAMVFQNYALYPHMSVAGNMGFSLKLARMPQPEARGRIARAAGILGLGDFLARFPAQLSGGQRQRVAMGRAIVRDTRVFLFDEPLSNLDAQLRVQMRGEIKQLHQRLGNTTVYVTHDQIEAMTMADRIVVMRDGIVEQAGAPLELYDSPANTFVARFIGSPAMNLMPATVRRGPAGPVAEVAPGVAMPLPDALPAAMEGRAVIWGLRPEHVERDEDGLALEVELVEPTGSETHIVLATGGDGRLVAVFRDRIAPAPGSRMGICPRADKALLFDAASGTRLWTPLA